MGNVFIPSIIDHEILDRRCVFPFLVGHVDAFKFAVHHALSAIDTAVHVIFHHIALGCTIQDNQLDGVRRAILHT